MRLGELPSKSPLPPEQARLRLYEAVGLFLAGIAARSGLLLLLDDLHWADPATLDLLWYVARSQPNARLLLLGAYREGEVTHRPAFERALTELNRLRLLTTITLGPLSEADLNRLATNALRSPVDPVLLRSLATRSEGNPFFAEELLRDWLATDRGLRNAPAQQEESSALLPSSIVGAVRSRTGRLDPQARELLQVASIIGRRFAVELLAGVAGQDAEAVEELLQEALRAQVIRHAGLGAFFFSHDLIRASLYDEVPLSRRTRLHTFIGRRLALQLHSDWPDAHTLSELSFHFARSSDQEQGVTYSLLAAEEAMHASAPEVAVEHYHMAMRLVEGSDPRRASWLEKLGEAALQAAMIQEAISAFQAALQRYERAGDGTATGRAALGLGRAYWRVEEISPAQEALERAVTLLSDDPSANTVRALVELGSLLLLSLHDYSEARLHLEQALTMARQLGETHLEASASRALGNLLWRAGDVTEGIALLQEGLALADEASDAVEAAECCECLFIASGWAGRFEGQEELLLRWLEYARLCHDPYQLRHIYPHLATLHAMRGEWAEMEEDLARSQELVERQPLPEPLTMLQWTRGMLLSLRGDLDTALVLVQESVARFRVLEPQSLVWWLGGYGIILAMRGQRKEALAVLDELEALVADLPAEAMPTAHALSHMVEVATRLHDRTWSERLYPRLLPLRGQFHAVSVDRLLGTFATELGDFAAAHDHLAAAEAMTRRFALETELAGTLSALADLSLAAHPRSGMASARDRLEEAVALYTQLGNQTEARRLRDRLRHLARKSSRPQLPASLTAREVEVLRLVAQGKSNREIAQTLVISERTVINHLASVFNKTDVDNRAGAAAFAIRHGLAE